MSRVACPIPALRNCPKVLPLTRTKLPVHPNLIAVAVFILAGVVLTGISYGASLMIERRSEKAVVATLAANSIDWVAVDADGLLVQLSGTAVNEAARFRAVNVVGTVVDSSRVRDGLEVAPTSAIEAPRFSIEMLRNDDGIQLIGLMPEATTTGGIDEDALASAAAALTPGIEVANMLEAAAYPAPASWDAALGFGVAALKVLKRAKISVAADQISVTAISDSDAEKRRLETDLRALKPAGVVLTLDISAPRPVITPFTLRFLLDDQGARFDACSADTDRARARILTVASAAGLSGGQCTIGLGVPTPSWADAVGAGIKAVQELGAGSITFSDADVSLVASSSTPQDTYDRVVGELQTALPPVFSLNAVLEKKADAANQGPAEFTAVLSTEGRVELRGRLTDERLRSAVDAFARAQFGADAVYTATRLDAELPDGWPVRVLAGLEALSELTSGSVKVRADTVEVTGITGSQAARARIAQILSAKLGQGKTFKVSVTYDEDLDPLAALPTPQECAIQVNSAVARQKITFTPGSAEIATTARPVIEALADILEDCPGIAMEIGGYTDAQGSEGGNQALSQARAEAVMVALQGRRIDVSGMTAKGYGEADPIADNSTDAGREANRRIEFVLTGEDLAPVGAAPTGGATADAVAPVAVAPDAGPDFSGDTSPSVAPTERTIRPKARPNKG